MAQTQTAAVKKQYPGDVIDYTPTSAVYAGDVVVIGNRPLVAPGDIAANTMGVLDVEGIYDVPKSSDVFVVGHPVFWDAAGTPVTGTAATGAAMNAAGKVMGVCLANANAAASYVRCRLGGLGSDRFISVASVNAAGSVIGNAAAVSYGMTIVAASDNSKGIQLPSCVPGAYCVVINRVTDKTLKVYPPTGKQISGAGANNAIVMAANAVDQFWCEGTNAWESVTGTADVA
jgi:predicted RecA/RadA family phage recombinase